MGLFITIEGGDGSGKTTQSDLLVKYLESIGKKVHRQKFPRYGQDSAYYIEQYLNGAYGEASDVPADLGVLPYALDRYAATEEIRQIIADPDSVLVCDRYMGSNLAHQGAKVDDQADRRQFYNRTLTTEYEVLGIPRPDLNIVLLVPANVAQSNVDKRPDRAYTDKKRDIHEADTDHLEKAKRNYEELCELYPNEFKAIDCMEDGSMRSIETIQADIQQLISSALESS